MLATHVFTLPLTYQRCFSFLFCSICIEFTDTLHVCREFWDGGIFLVIAAPRVRSAGKPSEGLENGRIGRSWPSVSPRMDAGLYRNYAWNGLKLAGRRVLERMKIVK